MLLLAQWLNLVVVPAGLAWFAIKLYGLRQRLERKSHV